MRHQLHEYLGIIHKETGRLNELINNFLDLQRIKAGQAVYHFKPVPVAAASGGSRRPLCRSPAKTADNRAPLR